MNRRSFLTGLVAAPVVILTPGIPKAVSTLTFTFDDGSTLIYGVLPQTRIFDVVGGPRPSGWAMTRGFYVSLWDGTDRGFVPSR